MYFNASLSPKPFCLLIVLLKTFKAGTAASLSEQ